METVGQYLRKERETKHISIEEVVLHTRIQPKFIEAIEGDHFDQIPNLVSAKGFLKSYSRFLQLDEAEALKRFSALYPPIAVTPPDEREPEPSPNMGMIGEPKTSNRHFYRFLKIFVGGVLVVFLLMAFISLWSKSSAPPLQTKAHDGVGGDDASGGGGQGDIEKPSKEPSSPPALESRSLSPDTVEQEKADRSSTAIPMVVPSISGVTTPMRPIASEMTPSPPNSTGAKVSGGAGKPSDRFPLPVSPNLILSLEAAEPTWAKVWVDGKTMKEVLLQGGEKISWEAEKTFQLTMGNAGGAKVFLDGKELGFLGERGEVIRNHLLTRSTIEQPPVQ